MVRLQINNICITKKWLRNKLGYTEKYVLEEELKNTTSENYWLPAEWHPHKATWLSWLHNEETWPKSILEKALPNYIEFIYYLALDEQVCINVLPNTTEAITTLLRSGGVNLAHVKLYEHTTNDSWCRDHGPDFLLHKTKKEKLILDWEYNCWGEKYPPFTSDNQIPLKIADTLGLGNISILMVLEGGSFDVNGEGVLLTTKSCLLNKNRNPTFSQEKIETYLKRHLNQKEVIWLEEGIIGDDTDGHIDDIARFVSSNKIVVATTDKGNENFEVLERNKTFLQENYGNRFEIIELPMPQKIEIDGIIVPASYTNFYIANNKVIVPIFGEANDEKALAILAKCFPERQIVGIDSSVIIYGLGSFHCLSKQEPQWIKHEV